MTNIEKYIRDQIELFKLNILTMEDLDNLFEMIEETSDLPEDIIQWYYEEKYKIDAYESGVYLLTLFYEE